MSKPLPEHVTRAEAAAVLRLSLRQVDRLAEAGRLKKVSLSASRSGFEREDFDRYLQSIGAAEGYTSPVKALTISLPVDSPIDMNRAAALLDALLVERFPGCLIKVDAEHIQIVWNAALDYTAEQISESLRW
ncbi:MAG TPA: hypothetical protein VHC71_14055 [Hyphomicrobium sp.]|jgi:hypothetical protein|nr:hypothetical protein [Hyphomicrobium sp.]